jgi:hypothetical protein
VARDKLCSRAGWSSERLATYNPFDFPQRQVGCCGPDCMGRARPWRWRGDWVVDDLGTGNERDLLLPHRSNPTPSTAGWRVAHSCGAAAMAPPATNSRSRAFLPSLHCFLDVAIVVYWCCNSILDLWQSLVFMM